MTVDYKVNIANFARASLGNFSQAAITSLSTNDPEINLIANVLEEVITYLMTDDWYFNRKRINLEDMTQIYVLEVDEAPSTAWSVGDTITGQTSGVTCVINTIINTTKFLVTKPSGDFTEDETLTDSVATAVYNTSSDDVEMGEYPYAYTLPSDYLLNLGVSPIGSDGIKYKTKREGQLLLSQANEGYYHYNRYIGTSGVSDIDDLPIWFHRLISARLAYVMSANIMDNVRIRPKAELDYKMAYLEAKEKNGMEEVNDEYEGQSNWSDKVWSEIDSL
jgi:hypothetical protein